MQMREWIMGAVLAGATGVAAPVAAQGTSDWTGLYGGVALGWGDVSGDVVLGDEISGESWGVFAGYQRDFGQLVVGGELDWSGAVWNDAVSGVNVDSVARAKARMGWDLGSLLPYAAIGAAQVSTSGTVEDTDTGWFYGAGVDYGLGRGITVGAEVLRHEFADYAGTGIDVSATTVAARVSYSF